MHSCLHNIYEGCSYIYLQSSSGESVVVHYWQNSVIGVREGFKSNELKN